MTHQYAFQRQGDILTRFTTTGTHKISSYLQPTSDEDRETGLIRHIQVRNNKNMTQWMVVLVVADYHFPSKKNFAKALVAPRDSHDRIELE